MDEDFRVALFKALDVALDRYKSYLDRQHDLPNKTRRKKYREAAAFLRFLEGKPLKKHERL